MLETYRPQWRDFLAISGLTRRAGCSESSLALVAVKEMVDNALDASPTGIGAGVQGRTVTVYDNGPGLSREQVLNIFAVNRPTLSSKRWRLARRGALGNGVRVILGVVHVSGGSLRISSRGTFYDIAVDPTSGETILLAEGPSETSTGLQVEITFGAGVGFDRAEIEDHLLFCQVAPGSAYGGKKAVPDWFSAETIADLMRDAMPGASALEFARSFDITAHGMEQIKALTARQAVGDLLSEPDRLSTYVDAIKGNAAPPRSLRKVGRGALPDGKYTSVQGTFAHDGVRLPFIVEVWALGRPVLNRKSTGRVDLEVVLVNRTPALMTGGTGWVDPEDKSFFLQIDGKTHISVDGVLKGPCNFDISLAITAPELPLVSDGKAVDMSVFEEVIEEALGSVLPRAYVRPIGKVGTRPTEKRITIKGAIYAIIEGVYNDIAAAGIGVPPRMLMYRCRPQILEMTGREGFDYQTFINAVHDFIEDHPEKTADWRLLYDNRGNFIEPGGRRFGLGTREVDGFLARLSDEQTEFEPTIDGLHVEHSAGHLRTPDNPSHRYSAAIFIEKEGYAELFENAKLAERYDVAICSTKGMPTTSIRRVFDHLARFGIRVFCLHDLDEAGLRIFNTLATDNRRFQFQNDIGLSDMGLRLDEARAMDLQDEPFSSKANKTKKRDLLRSYGATDDEIEMLVDQQRRIELDAMTPQQLIGFIERKLEEGGVRKVVPDEDTLAAIYRHEAYQHRFARAIEPDMIRIRDLLDELVEKHQDDDSLVADPPALSDAVRQHLQDHPTQTWQEGVRAVARAHERR